MFRDGSALRPRQDAKLLKTRHSGHRFAHPASGVRNLQRTWYRCLARLHEPIRQYN